MVVTLESHDVSKARGNIRRRLGQGLAPEKDVRSCGLTCPAQPKAQLSPPQPRRAQALVWALPKLCQGFAFRIKTRLPQTYSFS